MVFHVVFKIIDNREEVEDLAQEIFMKVFRSLSRFKFESKLSTWIAQIAYREAINQTRRTRKNYSLSELSEARGLRDEVNVLNQVNAIGLHDMVHRAIKSLPEHYRSVLVLYHLDEFSYPEIGEITGLPEGTVKNYIFRARKLLKEQLEPFVKKEEL
jgi:RNA polymerase sigma-70 factor (ECF subfamily)